MLILIPVGTVTISAGTSKSITGNENIGIELENDPLLPNSYIFETGELFTWNLTWEGIDNSSNNQYHYDYTFHAGYANNGTETYNGSGIGFPTVNGSLSFSIPTFELWKNGTYEYTIRCVLWDQSRNQLLDYTEMEFVIFQTTINPNASKFLVFGDSLSDMGNSKATYGTPESPPYYYGRFSTGPMWNEHVATELGLTPSPGTGSNSGSNRAFGGAEAGDGLNYFVIPNLGKQIEDYTNNYWIGPNEKVAVWGGGNNFLNSGETNTQKVVNYLVDHVNDLNSDGASDIIVLNMPPLEKTPTYSGESDSDKQAMHARMIDFNAKLETAMIARESALNINIQLIDIFEMFETIYWNGSFYGITNSTHAACHHDGITCDSNDYIEPTVDQFIFFDNIHPTGTTHKLLGMYVIEQIGIPDTDGDGIENNIDNCPKTPIGDLVNHFGCRLVDLDSDEDGINDLLDQCPGTSNGSIVDENGCADYQKDGDNDGVSDDIDICPQSAPVGITVDSNGCADYQKDSDEDGVTDDQDSCPNTDSNLSVNIVGCAENQIDQDWDGVMNNIDLCPNTPSGENVDVNGCSLSQLDSDGDEINDENDLCPNTPLGAEIDSVGCSLSQLDTDEDGVSDDIDICDFTPTDEVANEVGCSPSQRDSDGDGRVDSRDECELTPGSIRGCPSMSISLEVIHWPSSYNDSAVLTMNASCENDCLFNLSIDNEWYEDQTPHTRNIEFEPKVESYELVVRIEHQHSWAEKRVDIFWPLEPIIIDEIVDDTTDDANDAEGDTQVTEQETESWQSSALVDSLLAILMAIGITLTLGSIIRMNRGNRAEKQQHNWIDPMDISTIEVEQELRNMPSQVEVSPLIEETTIPIIDELFEGRKTVNRTMA